MSFSAAARRRLLRRCFSVGSRIAATAPVTAECIDDYPLNLPVDRTKFLRRPSLDFFHCGGVKAEQEALSGFFFSHSGRVSVIKCAGVYYWLRGFVGAENY